MWGERPWLHGGGRTGNKGGGFGGRGLCVGVCGATHFGPHVLTLSAFLPPSLPLFSSPSTPLHPPTRMTDHQVSLCHDRSQRGAVVEHPVCMCVAGGMGGREGWGRRGGERGVGREGMGKEGNATPQSATQTCVWALPPAAHSVCTHLLLPHTHAHTHTCSSCLLCTCA